MRQLFEEALEYKDKDARIVPIIGAYYRIPDPEVKMYLLYRLDAILSECIRAELSRLGQEIDDLMDDNDPRKYKMEG